MNSQTTAAFWTHFDALPQAIQVAARLAYERWQRDTTHPSLHFKPVSRRTPVWSVRINDNSRALGLRDGDTVTWFWIGPHAAYERLLKRV